MPLQLYPPPLGRAATVMRYGGHILYRLYLQTYGFQGSDCRFPPRARTSNFYIDTPDPMFPCFIASRLSCQLGGKRGPLAGAFEADSSGTRPAYHIALTVGNAHNSVVKGSLNVSNTEWDILLNLPAGTLLFLPSLCFSHWFFPLKLGCALLTPPNRTPPGTLLCPGIGIGALPPDG